MASRAEHMADSLILLLCVHGNTIAGIYIGADRLLPPFQDASSQKQKPLAASEGFLWAFPDLSHWSSPDSVESCPCSFSVFLTITPWAGRTKRKGLIMLLIRFLFSFLFCSERQSNRKYSHSMPETRSIISSVSADPSRTGRTKSPAPRASPRASLPEPSCPSPSEGTGPAFPEPTIWIPPIPGPSIPCAAPPPQAALPAPSHRHRTPGQARIWYHRYPGAPYPKCPEHFRHFPAVIPSVDITDNTVEIKVCPSVPVKGHEFRPEGVVLCRSPYHVEGPPLLPVIFLHFNIGLQTASPFPVF